MELLLRTEEESSFPDEMPGKILQDLRLSCDTCVKCFTASSGKPSDDFRHLVVTARRLLTNEMADNMHCSEVGKVVVQDFRTSIDTTWIKCSVHFSTIADTLFNSIIKYLLHEHCKRINKGFKIAEGPAKNTRKLIQEAGVKIV